MNEGTLYEKEKKNLITHAHSVQSPFGVLAKIIRKHKTFGAKLFRKIHFWGNDLSGFPKKGALKYFFNFYFSVFNDDWSIAKLQKKYCYSVLR